MADLDQKTGESNYDQIATKNSTDHNFNSKAKTSRRNPKIEQPFAKKTSRSNDFRTLSLKKKEFGEDRTPGPGSYRTKDSDRSRAKVWRNYSKDSGRSNYIPCQNMSLDLYKQQNVQMHTSARTKTFRGTLGDTANKKHSKTGSKSVDSEQGHVDENTQNSLESHTFTYESQYQSRNNPYINLYTQQKGNKDQQNFDKSTKHNSKSKDSLICMPEESKLASFDEYSGYQIINLPNNIAYDAKKSKESKEIKISKSEKMRNKLKYLAWLKKNQIEHYDSSSSMIDEQKRKELNELTVKQRQKKLKDHYNMIKKKNMDLTKKMNQGNYTDTSDIQGFQIKHFRGHTDKRFSTPFFRSTFDVNVEENFGKTELQPNYDFVRTRQAMGVPIFNFNKFFLEKVKQRLKSNSELNSDRRLQEEKNRRFREQNVNK